RQRRRCERRRLRRRGVGAGSDQRRRAVVPRAALGGVAAGRTPHISVAMTPLGAFFESYYRLRPVNATFTGIHDHDHRLPDWSPDGLASAADEMRALRRSLAGGREPV